MPEMTNNQEYNPLLEIDTSFRSYLDARTRTYTEHIVGGRMDYAFGGDFGMRSKINTMAGWNKLYKTLTVSEIPNHFKKLFKSADIATSMLHANAYNAASKCSARLKVSPPSIMVKKAKEVPEIYSIAGDGIETSIVISSDIAEMCTLRELCYLFGCELGRIQNKHTAYNYAMRYIENNTGKTELSPDVRLISYAMKSWLLSADITADRAGIICLDDPSEFPETYISIRKKCIRDSFGNIDSSLNISDLMEKYQTMRTASVRSLNISSNTSADERRIICGMEFTGCEILYNWRSDLKAPDAELMNKQSLEIRCDIISGADGQTV